MKALTTIDLSALIMATLIATIPSNISQVAVSAGVNTVLVNPSNVIQTIPSTFFGVNDVGFWDSAQGSNASAAALAQTPIKLLRFPGGVPGDWSDWAEPYYNGTSPGSGSWSGQSPLNVWTYAQKFGATPMFQTNYQGNNLPNPPVTPQETCAVHASSGDCELDSLQGNTGARQPYAVNSPQNNAAFVTYNKAHGIPALMEIGNEEDIHMTSRDDPNFQPYVTAFNADATAMHAADSNVKVIGPAATNEWYWWYNNSPGNNSPDSLNMFLQGTGNIHGTGQVDGVSLHYYVGSGWADTKSAAQSWMSSGGDWHTIQQSITANDTRKLPVYVTEWNVGDSDAGTGFNQTMGHALAMSDILGAFATSGVAGETYFDTHSSTTYGLLYGTGEGQPADTATPSYYAMALWKYMGNQVIQSTQSADAASVMSTYATKKNDGSVQLMAINKTSTEQTVQFSLNGLAVNGQNMKVVSVSPQNGSVADQNTMYNGVLDPSDQSILPGPLDGGAISGSSVSYLVPAYSTVALLIPSASVAPTYTPTSIALPTVKSINPSTPTPTRTATHVATVLSLPTRVATPATSSTAAAKATATFTSAATGSHTPAASFSPTETQVSATATATVLRVHFNRMTLSRQSIVRGHKLLVTLGTVSSGNLHQLHLVISFTNMRKRAHMSVTIKGVAVKSGHHRLLENVTVPVILPAGKYVISANLLNRKGRILAHNVDSLLLTVRRM